MSKKVDIIRPSVFTVGSKTDDAASTREELYPQKEESQLDKISTVRKLEDVISENEELKMATTILCEIRDARKRQIFLQMAAEIEDLKKKLTKALDFAEHYQKRAKSLTLENDWLHSLTNTPAVSPAKQTVRTPMNLDEISEKLKKIGCQKITLDPNGAALELVANGFQKKSDPQLNGINSIPREAKRGRARNRPRKIIDPTYKQINSNPEKDDSNSERNSSTPTKMQGPTLRSHASECGTKPKLPCNDCKY